MISYCARLDDPAWRAVLALRGCRAARHPLGRALPGRDFGRQAAAAPWCKALLFRLAAMFHVSVRMDRQARAGGTRDRAVLELRSARSLSRLTPACAA